MSNQSMDQKAKVQKDNEQLFPGPESNGNQDYNECGTGGQREYLNRVPLVI